MFKDENFPTVKEIKDFVQKYVEEMCDGEYPEDEWYGVAKWDFNMHMPEPGVKWVTVYPVNVPHNDTDSSRGICIEI